MIGTIKNNKHLNLSYQTLLYQDINEALIDDMITVIDAFELIKQAIELGRIEDNEAFEILDKLINDGLISENDLNDF